MSTAGLVVFDFDNTVVHSTIDFAAIRRAIIALLRRHRVTDESDDALTRLSIGQIIELGDDHDARTGTALGPAAWQIVLEYEVAGMRDATIEPRAAETLSELRRRGFALAILTNNARPATFEALDKFGLVPAFELVLTRDEVAMKPDPAGILRARQLLDGADGRAVVVGDSWLDGSAAQRAGVPFIAFRPRPGVLEERVVPIWTVVERLDQLGPILDGPWPGID